MWLGGVRAAGLAARLFIGVRAGRGLLRARFPPRARADIWRFDIARLGTGMRQFWRVQSPDLFGFPRLRKLDAAFSLWVVSAVRTTVDAITKAIHFLLRDVTCITVCFTGSCYVSQRPVWQRGYYCPFDCWATYAAMSVPVNPGVVGDVDADCRIIGFVAVRRETVSIARRSGPTTIP